MISDLARPSLIWQNPGTHHLTALSNPWYAIIARLQNSFAELTMSFWSARNAQTLFLPVTTGSISSPMGLGSDSRPVEIELEGARTHLADSMQFMLEYGCRLVKRDCYYLMPSFRGEKSDETHLSQFFHSEAELQGGLNDVLATVEDYLVYLAVGLLERNADDIARVAGSIDHLTRLANSAKFNRLTFDEAERLLDGFGVRSNGTWRTLSRDAERELLSSVGEFTWVTNWDHLAVPFYQAFAPDGRTAINADLLFGVGEVVGAGERHESKIDAIRALALHQVDATPYQWYLEMRQVQPLRTAGFGLGVERFLLWVLDHHDIRDMQLLPRENGRSITP